MRIARARRKKGGKEKKAPIAAFILATLEIVSWLTLSKLHLDIQLKSNFAHKVKPKLNIVRLLFLFHV